MLDDIIWYAPEILLGVCALFIIGGVLLCARWIPCHKEQLGYTCRHRTLPDGNKECGVPVLQPQDHEL